MDDGVDALARTEQLALRVMWKRVRVETEHMEGLDLATLDEESLLRFLRAHSLDADKAAEAYADWQKWRINFGVRDLKLADVLEELEREVLSLVEGRDRAGRPVLVLAARRCVPPEFQLLPFVMAATYLLERAVRSRGGDGTLGVMIDYARVDIQHCDARVLRLLVDLLAHRYPLHVAYFIVAHKPAFFPELWGAAAPSMPPWLLERTHVLGEAECLPKLREEMEDACIPHSVGGTYFHNTTTQLYLWKGEEVRAAVKAQKGAGAETGADEGAAAQAAPADVSDAVPMRAGVVRAGSMMKQGGTLKAWTSRHFVLLYTGSLQYFKDDRATDAKGAISLREGRVWADVDPGVKARPFTLQLLTPSKMHYLTCKSDADMRDWIAALNRVVERVQGISHAAPTATDAHGEAISPSKRGSAW